MTAFRAGLLAIGLLLPLATPAQVTLHGVKYEASADVRGSKLVLNGAGTRYKGPFKVYTAALYVSRKGTTTEDVLAAPGAKRITVTMLRDIDATEMGKMFTRGMEDNMDRGAMVKLIPGILRMSQIFSDHKRLLAGETFSIDWVPGTGSVVTLRGETQGAPFKEQAFFEALLRIWIGPVPADWKLKESLLGKQA